MGKLRKIRRAVEKNPKVWMHRQPFPKVMFKAKYAKFMDGSVIPASPIDPDRGYRMYVRKCIQELLGYTDNMIE